MQWPTQSFVCKAALVWMKINARLCERFIVQSFRGQSQIALNLNIRRKKNKPDSDTQYCYRLSCIPDRKSFEESNTSGWKVPHWIASAKTPWCSCTKPKGLSIFSRTMMPKCFGMLQLSEIGQRMKKLSFFYIKRIKTNQTKIAMCTLYLFQKC